MNNELINIEGNMSKTMLAHVQAEMEKSEKVSAGVGGGATLPKLSIAGKEFSVRIGGQSQPLRTFTLDVIIADSREGISKQYYENAYDPQQAASQPDCASVDGITPDFAPAIIDKETGKCPCNCRDCYFNKFGTAKQGKGKACKDYKRLIVLLAGTDQNPFDPKRPPLTLDLPATSFHAPQGSAGVMMLREFCDVCKRNKMPESMVVAELSFMSGTAFSQLCMRPKRIATDAEYNRVLEVRQMDDVQSALKDKFEPRSEELPEETQQALSAPVEAPKPVEQPKQEVVEPAPVFEEKPAEKEPELVFDAATPKAQENAVATPVEVSADEAEAIKQLDDFFATIK